MHSQTAFASSHFLLLRRGILLQLSSDWVVNIAHSRKHHTRAEHAVLLCIRADPANGARSALVLGKRVTTEPCRPPDLDGEQRPEQLTGIFRTRSCDIQHFNSASVSQHAGNESATRG